MPFTSSTLTRSVHWLLSTVVCGSISAQTALYVPGGAIGSSSNGNVGIGTASPAQRLTVEGSGSTSALFTNTSSANTSVNQIQLSLPNVSANVNTAFRLVAQPSGDLFRTSIVNNGTEQLTVLSGGKVGIGTTNPQARLQVVGDLYVSTSGSALVRAYGPTTGFELTDQTSYLYLRPYHAITGDMPLQIGPGAGGLRIDTAGKVGVGTTTPQAKLQVAGDLYVSTSSGSALIRAYGPTTGFEFADQTSYLSLRPYHAVTGDKPLQIGPGVGGLRIDTSGNVGIGTTNPGTHKLAVNGTIKAKEIIVDITGWSDYVFDESYQLSALSEVERFIKEKKHLPGIPSAAEIEQGGVSLGDMQARLLAKVEELTLHVIRLNREVQDLRADNMQLRSATGMGNP